MKTAYTLVRGHEDIKLILIRKIPIYSLAFIILKSAKGTPSDEKASVV